MRYLSKSENNIRKKTNAKCPICRMSILSGQKLVHYCKNQAVTHKAAYACRDYEVNNLWIDVLVVGHINQKGLFEVETSKHLNYL